MTSVDLSSRLLRKIPLNLLSPIEAVSWPAVLSGPDAQVMALQYQLNESQWWSPDRVRAHQFQQLGQLATHAVRHVPFYAERLRAAGLELTRELTEASWARVPILTRSQAQQAGDALNARSVPQQHGTSSVAASSGSSGVPVRVRKTELDNLLWFAAHVREELWHRDGARGVLARIRRVPPKLTAEQALQVRSPAGLMLPDWGPPISRLWQTGPMGVLDDRVAIADQAAFLERLQPEYLHVFPANLRLVLNHFREQRARLQSLRSVWTMSETVDDSLRELCHDVFGCRIVHHYSAAETGYIALQCPKHEDRYHVQAESLLLEVLDDAGLPCKSGEIGRVFVTPLHSFATPLLRYEIGDEAEVGEMCACGRGLPVIRRIVGRVNDYLVTPSGQRHRVESGYYRLCKIPAIREFQLVQRAVDHVELAVVLSRPLTEHDTAEIQGMLRHDFSPELRFTISVRDVLPRTAAGKLRTFISEVSPPGPEHQYISD